MRNYYWSLRNLVLFGGLALVAIVTCREIASIARENTKNVIIGKSKNWKRYFEHL
jgi:hypothetical protein